MAKIERRVNGEKITRVIARTAVVQKRLDDLALERALKAESLLRAHTDSGDSRITVDQGRIDRFVNLDDTRGEWAARAIEFGHRGRFVEGKTEDGDPVSTRVGAAEGLFVLHRAFGIRGH